MIQLFAKDGELKKDISKAIKLMEEPTKSKRPNRHERRKAKALGKR